MDSCLSNFQRISDSRIILFCLVQSNPRHNLLPVQCRPSRHNLLPVHHPDTTCYLYTIQTKVVFEGEDKAGQSTHRHAGEENFSPPSRPAAICRLFKLSSFCSSQDRFANAEINKNKIFSNEYIVHTVCPRSSDPFHVVTYYIKWVITSWTDST